MLLPMWAGDRINAGTYTVISNKAFNFKNLSFGSQFRLEKNSREKQTKSKVATSIL